MATKPTSAARDSTNSLTKSAELSCSEALMVRLNRVRDNNLKTKHADINT